MTSDIPLDKAELLALVLEALLYGFSLFMFGGTIWTLSSNRSSVRVKCRMLAASCSLLLFSTVHLIIDVIRVMEGLILLPDNYRGGRIRFFSDVAHWTFVAKNYVYAAQTLIGDGVVLYRCYAVWQSKLVMIVPAMLWCVVSVTSFACPYTESRIKEGGVFEKTLARWITSFWTSTLVMNVVTTSLLAYRIWNVDQRTKRMSDNHKSELRPILHIIIDAGGIYSVTLFTALICYVNKSNGQYVILDMIMPIISITFYMVIIRVGLANRASQAALTHSCGNTCSNHVLTVERGSKLPIDITILHGSRSDTGHRLSMSPTSPISCENPRRSDIKFEDIEEEV